MVLWDEATDSLLRLVKLLAYEWDEHVVTERSPVVSHTELFWLSSLVPRIAQDLVVSMSIPGSIASLHCTRSRFVTVERYPKMYSVR